MTISANEALFSGPYAGNGVTTVFDYDFKIYAEEELTVSRFNANGSTDLLTLAVDYTVSGVGDDGGGTITLTGGGVLPTGASMTIEPNITASQERPLAAQSSISLKQLEYSLDKLTSLARQILGLNKRSLKLPPGAGEPLDLEVPTANSTMVWNGDATRLVNGPSVSEVTGAAQAAQDAATYRDLAMAWAESPGQPGGVGTESAKSWAGASEAFLNQFASQYLGVQASDPVVDGNGDPVAAGAIYYNSTSGVMRVFTGLVWDDITSAVSVDERIRATAAVTADWDLALANGWYVGTGAFNAPEASALPHIGRVIAEDASWVVQEAWRHQDNTDLNNMMYRRHKRAGVWGPWYVVPDTRALGDRLATVGKTITGWNTATENGYYFAANGAANAPAAEPTYGIVRVADTPNDLAQTVWGVTSGKRWQRLRTGGAWGAWTQTYGTATELYSLPFARTDVPEELFSGSSVGGGFTVEGWLTVNEDRIRVGLGQSTGNTHVYFKDTQNGSLYAFYYNASEGAFYTTARGTQGRVLVITGHADKGQYVFAKNVSGAAKSANETINGANLQVSNHAATGGNALPGSWRALGYAPNNHATLWQRIS